MTLNNEIRSGESFTLSMLLSGDRKVVIPDLQRDYCWGSSSEGVLVEKFMDSILDNLESVDLMLGMVYAYEEPVNYFQLCDGQQRITTLYLIIGMLYRIRPDFELKNCLISKYDYEADDREPRLQYAIRESTLYFLSDLVANFFINGENIQVNDIRNQRWYFDDYNLDPSITSMIDALVTIEKVLKSKYEQIENIVRTVCNRLYFLYYDIVERERGEELYVVINTTGEPLTPTENLKPLIIGLIAEESERTQKACFWEEMETWFWNNRAESEHCADDGLLEFLKWYLQIRQLQSAVQFLSDKSLNDYKEINTIERYFRALQSINIMLRNNGAATAVLAATNKRFASASELWLLRNLDENMILPLLEFAVRFPEAYPYQFIRRLRKNYFDWRRKERQCNFLDWRYLVQMVDHAIDSEELLVFSRAGNFLKAIDNVLSNSGNWFNDDERMQHKLKESNRDEVEMWEDDHDFMGDLKPLFDVSVNCLDIHELGTMREIYSQIRPPNFSLCEDIELKALYLLYDLLYRGKWENGTVAGYGYCMLVRNDEIPFLSGEFSNLWHECYVNRSNSAILKGVLLLNIKNHFVDLVWENQPIDAVLRDLKEYNRHKIVKIWILLEFCHARETLVLDGFVDVLEKWVGCYWNNPWLLKPENDNEYSIGNILPGTSYKYNKCGGLHYVFPLMSILEEERREGRITRQLLSDNTNRFIELIMSVMN